MDLQVKGLKAGYDKTIIIDGMDVQISPGAITALIGSNGCGKSTLLKTICRILSPMGGNILLDGRDIYTQSTRELATKMAILPQNPNAPRGLTVRELVSYGRSPHKQGIFRHTTAKDKEIIDWALTETNMMQFENRAIDNLSGGQRQRAWIAMAVAQDTEVLFLDEPTSFLDIAHQMEVLQLITRLNQNFGKTFVMVLHELNQAARFADYIIAMKDGRIRFQGNPQEVLNQDMLLDVFGVDGEIIEDPRTGRPFCIPYLRNS